MCQLHLKPERKKINTAFVNSEKKDISELTSFFSLTTDISFISIGSDGKASAYNTGDLGLIPGLGRSPGEGNGTHSSTLARKILWTEDPGRLQSMGSQRVGHD